MYRINKFSNVFRKLFLGKKIKNVQLLRNTMQSSVSTETMPHASTSRNPFTIGDPCQLFGYRERALMETKYEKEKIKTMSLTQRQELLRPVCSTSHSAQRSQASSKQSSRAKTSFSRTRASRENKMWRMTEFIQQKREIYMYQLVEDTANKEIEKIKRTIKQNEDKLSEREENIRALAEKLKLGSSQSEQQLVAEIRKAEECALQRKQLQGMYRAKEHEIGLIKADISKNKELLEEYTSYNNFLKKIAPDGKGASYFFNDTDLLLSEFNKIETDNLFLIKEFLALNNTINFSKATGDEKLRRIEEAILSITPIVKEKVPEASYDDLETLKNVNETFALLNNEIQEIGSHILKTYVGCYNENPQTDALHMLSKINADLESYYNKVEELSALFIKQKQAKLDKERREQIKLRAQKDKEELQRIKKEQAIERANKPIKRKTGRPLLPRTALRKFKKDNSEKEKLLEMERMKQQEMLFGSCF